MIDEVLLDGSQIENLEVSNVTSKTITRLKNQTELTTFNPDFSLKLVSVLGDIKAQTVAVSFLITHKLGNQLLCFYHRDVHTYVKDVADNKYFSEQASVGNMFVGYYSVCNRVLANIPIQTKVVFKNINPEVDVFSNITIKVSNEDLYADYSEFSFIKGKNLVIDWK
ncbi:hypothetical protein JM658_02635 [Joostella atrarenae]|uniref:Uncharacterized protein n=1 Tax=Joostella atrarenae TaxID=679257 RepID=A0ABS9IZV7_9FLAO|nr:hypothetical protein [Joostella atrarenae]MCF8713711.1 hypothetical protein [Joostella atrarenae]